MKYNLLKPPHQELWRPEQVQHEVQEPPSCILLDNTAPTPCQHTLHHLLFFLIIISLFSS